MNDLLSIIGVVAIAFLATDADNLRSWLRLSYRDCISS